MTTKAQPEPSASKKRRERERQEMRVRLLEAARVIASEEGWNAVTIRRIAGKLEYSAPILYQHFSSKEDLLVELMTLGFAELSERLSLAAEGAPEGRLVAMAEAYWAFAFASPELYQAMNGMDGVPFGTAETPLEARNAFRVFRGALQDIAQTRGGRAGRSSRCGRHDLGIPARLRVTGDGGQDRRRNGASQDAHAERPGADVRRPVEGPVGSRSALLYGARPLYGVNMSSGRGSRGSWSQSAVAASGLAWERSSEVPAAPRRSRVHRGRPPVAELVEPVAW
ncbi:TetR/AcrR family transcriptional regulator [Nonomuraea helvata]|uniref:TetR/AcrR family transcriptional regulator n=1 Tax=Nonomuraea helvata TaxID=37484 RepID=UPI0031EDA39B